MKDWEAKRDATGNHDQKRAFTLYDPLIYGKHNSVSTIEQVYIDPLKSEIKIWEGIVKKFEELKDYSHLEWGKQVLKEYRDSIAHFEKNKHLLGGVSRGEKDD